MLLHDDYSSTFDPSWVVDAALVKKMYLKFTWLFRNNEGANWNILTDTSAFKWSSRSRPLASLERPRGLGLMNKHLRPGADGHTG